MDNGSEAGMEMLRQEAVQDEAIQMVTNKTNKPLQVSARRSLDFTLRAMEATNHF